MPFYFRNADGDELLFVHRGAGVIETDFGPLEFEKGDYINLPRAVTYRISPTTKRQLLPHHRIEGRVRTARKRLDRPTRPLRSRQLSSSRTPRRIWTTIANGKSGLRSRASYSKVFYPCNPLDVVGWKGDLTVWKINMRDIRPVMSHRAHLPPSAHTTFVTKGAVVCSFLPRPLEEDPDALHVPFFHRNTDYDEFLFYHDGDFFSKDNIKPGMATLHPRGIHHGPHPKALANQGKKTHTDEYAVMLDGLNPIHVLPAGEQVEWQDYWRSWGAKPEEVLEPSSAT